MEPEKPSELGKGGSGDALADALHVLAGRVELDALQLGEVRLQHLLRRVHHHLAAFPGRHAAKNQHMIDVQILAVLSDGVTHVHANGLVDLAALGLLRRVLHRCLDLLQALRVGRVVHLVHVRVIWHHVLWQIDSALLGQARGRALAQVHRGITTVRRPRIARALWVHVQRAIGVLVDPASEGAIRVHVTRALAAAQGNAKEASLADHLATCNRRDLAIVDDLDWHTTELVLRDDVEDWSHLLLVDIGGHVWEAVTPRRLALGRNGAGRAAPDGDDSAGQFSRHLFHSLHDEVVVVLRIRIGDVPLRLLRIHYLAVLDRNRLHIALPQVEGNPCATGNLPRHDGLLARFRQVSNAARDRHRP
mmetsp:Transcript_24887/g.56565  ORF Transcript_24887/g.56565 Transcript_24887/m.56565 type:complete len:362 (+) Transcript_24887:30-1115(+)